VKKAVLLSLLLVFIFCYAAEATVYNNGPDAVSVLYWGNDWINFGKHQNQCWIRFGTPDQYCCTLGKDFWINIDGNSHKIIGSLGYDNIGGQDYQTTSAIFLPKTINKIKKASFVKLTFYINGQPTVFTIKGSSLAEWKQIIYY